MVCRWPVRSATHDDTLTRSVQRIRAIEPLIAALYALRYAIIAPGRVGSFLFEAFVRRSAGRAFV